MEADLPSFPLETRGRRGGLGTTDLWRKVVKAVRHGEGARLSTSLSGMYGEICESGLLAIHAAMQEYGLDGDSVVLDIGSGRGVPNALFACNSQIRASIGVEKCSHAFRQSVGMLKDIWQLDKGETVNVGFANDDVSAYADLEPTTHIYAFDSAMERPLVNHLAHLFSRTGTAWFYASFRRDLVRNYGLERCSIVKKIKTQMTISKENRTCYVYVKDGWEAIKAAALAPPPAYPFQVTRWMQPVDIRGLVALARLPRCLAESWYSSLTRGRCGGVVTRSRRAAYVGYDPRQRERENALRDQVLRELAAAAEAEKPDLLARLHQVNLTRIPKTPQYFARVDSPLLAGPALEPAAAPLDLGEKEAEACPEAGPRDAAGPCSAAKTWNRAGPAKRRTPSGGCTVKQILNSYAASAHSDSNSSLPLLTPSTARALEVVSGDMWTLNLSSAKR